MQEPTGQSPIYMLDLKSEVVELRDELRAAVDRVLNSGSFVLGEEGNAFEAEVAKYLGVQHAIGLNSGTDALIIGLRALGIGPGDEVITTPFTFLASAEPIALVGATPVFVDIEYESFDIDPELVDGYASYEGSHACTFLRPIRQHASSGGDRKKAQSACD